MRAHDRIRQLQRSQGLKQFWEPTGWSPRAIIRYSVVQPACIDATLHRWNDRKRRWHWWIGHLPANGRGNGPYRSAAAAARACEAALLGVLADAIRSLKKGGD